MDQTGFMKSGTIDRYPPMHQRLKRAIIKCFRPVCGSFRFVNGITQSCFIFGLVSIAGWGVGVAIPTLYSEDTYTAPCMRVFGCFLAIQIIVNWICLKTVDSSYKPYKHGTKPEHVRTGEILNRIRPQYEYANGTGSMEGGNVTHRHEMTNDTMMHVATNIKASSNGEPVQRTAFAYFSWTPCLRCNRLRPPRCHHCPSCNTCVLKRDHHCFVSGVCVGYYNLRHFTVFITWASVATIFATLHALPYYYYEVYEFVSIFDLFFPLAIVRCIFGYIQFKYAFLVVVLWVLIGFLLWSTQFFQEVYAMVRTGLTSFEKDNSYMMYDVRPLDQRLEAVFGHFWWLNFLVPLHFVFKPVDDPLNWPYLRA